VGNAYTNTCKLAHRSATDFKGPVILEPVSRDRAFTSWKPRKKVIVHGTKRVITGAGPYDGSKRWWHFQASHRWLASDTMSSTEACAVPTAWYGGCLGQNEASMTNEAAACCLERLLKNEPWNLAR